MADRVTQAQARVNVLSEQLCSGIDSLLMQPKAQTEANIAHFAQAIADSLLSISAIVRTLPACPSELSQQSLQLAQVSVVRCDYLLPLHYQEANQRQLDQLAAAVTKVGASSCYVNVSHAYRAVFCKARFKAHCCKCRGVEPAQLRR